METFILKCTILKLMLLGGGALFSTNFKGVKIH